MVSALLATVIGTLAALALVRYRFRLREFTRAYFLSVIIIPEIITGIALLSFATLLGVRSGVLLVVIGHVLFGLPFVVTVVSARLVGFDRSLEEAAMDLGADELRTFWRVTLPLLMPGILGGLPLAFTVSFDNFLITYLLAGSDVMTIPVHIYIHDPLRVHAQDPRHLDGHHFRLHRLGARQPGPGPPVRPARSPLPCIPRPL